MYRSVVVSAALVLLCGCNDGSTMPSDVNEFLQSTCTDMGRADPSARSDQLATGMIAKTCTCYAGRMRSIGGDEEELHEEVWRTIAITSETSEEKEMGDIGREIAAQLENNPDAYAFSMSEFARVGRFIGELGNEFERTGKCPTR